MQDAVLIIAMIGVFAFGLYLMKCIDVFLAGGESNSKSDNLVQKDVLLFCDHDCGNTEIEKLIKTLGEEPFSLDIVDSPGIPSNSRYGVVIALSSNDMDNLMLCAVAKHTHGDNYTIAKCNDRLYESIFRRQDVDALVYDAKNVVPLLCGRVVK